LPISFSFLLFVTQLALLFSIPVVFLVFSFLLAVIIFVINVQIIPHLHHLKYYAIDQQLNFLKKYLYYLLEVNLQQFAIILTFYDDFD